LMMARPAPARGTKRMKSKQRTETSGVTMSLSVTVGDAVEADG
jgi:hypothetical protein